MVGPAFDSFDSVSVKLHTLISKRAEFNISLLYCRLSYILSSITNMISTLTTVTQKLIIRLRGSERNQRFPFFFLLCWLSVSIFPLMLFSHCIPPWPFPPPPPLQPKLAKNLGSKCGLLVGSKKPAVFHTCTNLGAVQWGTRWNSLHCEIIWAPQREKAERLENWEGQDFYAVWLVAEWKADGGGRCK